MATNNVVSMVRPRHAALVFTGKDVTEFLEDYDRQADNGGLSDEMRVSVLPDYIGDEDRSIARIVKLFAGYKEKDWAKLKANMKEYWADEDTAVKMGKRSYLQAFIHKCVNNPPSLTEYYTHFHATAEACVANKQVPQEELGFLFYRGLPKHDKQTVAFMMPDAPKGDDWAEYHVDKIYTFLKEHHRKANTINDMHTQERGGMDAEMRRIMLTNKRATFDPAKVKDAIADLQKQQEKQESLLPPSVDPEVEELVTALNGMKLDSEILHSFMAHSSVAPIFKNPHNALYFMGRASKVDPPVERNDGSFVTKAPRNTAPKGGTIQYGRAEYTNTCHMCNEEGHKIADCELYNNLRNLGWISHHWDNERKQGTYYFGPPHDRLDRIPGTPPSTLKLEWLRSKIKEYFNVTDDMTEQPASSVLPEKFKGDSRPKHVLKQTNTANVATHSDHCVGHEDARQQFIQFQEGVEYSEEVQPLDDIDSNSIIIGGEDNAFLHSAEGNAIGHQNKSILNNPDRVRDGHVKKRGRPSKQSQSSQQLPEEDAIRQVPNSQASDTTMRPEDSWAEQPFLPQAPDTPFAVVRPPADVRIDDNMSADPRHLLQGRKKKAVKFSDALPDPELKELIKGQPNRIATALLSQEVRGVTVSDLMSQDNIANQLRNLLKEDGVGVDSVGTVNSFEAGRATDFGWALFSPEICAPSRASAPHHRASHEHPSQPPPTTWLRQCDTNTSCNTVDVYHSNAQTRHEVTGRGDSWGDSLDRIPTKAVRGVQRRAGRAFVQTDLPEAWVHVYGDSVKCLIDTGAQMNILRLSAARALKIPYEHQMQRLGDLPQGVTSANGGHEPFIGTAFDVPVRIGTVVIHTTFRIVANLTRSAILGGPWCAASCIGIQYNAFGRVQCRIQSEDGTKLVSFVASDPEPTHPSSTIDHEQGEDDDDAAGHVQVSTMTNSTSGPPQDPPAVRYLHQGAWCDPTYGFGQYNMLFPASIQQAWRRWMRSLFDDGAEAPRVDEDTEPIVQHEQELTEHTVMCEINREKMLDHARRTHQQPEVATLYKTVDKKVRPVDVPRADEPMEFGREDWKERAIQRQQLRLSVREPDPGPHDDIFEPRYAVFPRGTRLTPERLANLHIGSQVTREERDLFIQMLYNREAALSWEFTESGRIHPDVCPPYKIRTVEHKAWQARGFAVPKKLEQVVVNMANARLNRGTWERCDSQYRNPWHLVPKKDGGARWISNAQKINAVSIRDANLPPTADEFSERFAGCLINSLMDLYSGYDQITLHTASRDMTAFQTPVGLLRSCTMVMGATNSVAAFQRVMMKILKDHWPNTMVFVDDITCGGPKTDYGGEMAMPGVRRYVYEHILQLDRVLADIERAGGTVSGKKCYFLMERLEVVGYEISPEGRHPNSKKVQKLLDWPPCRDVRDVRSFLGLCVYYRIWVKGFTTIAKPLFYLLRGDVKYEWGPDQDQAMYTLKHAICSAPALASLDYSDTLKYKVFLMTDASQDGGGACLEQLQADGRRHPIRFESTLWSARERLWHSTKLECKAVLWALKKFRTYLYGIHFTIETDAATLIAQLNRSSTDNPGSVMNRWISTILLWDFDIVHVPGKKNVVADALSRYPKPDDWVPPEEPEDDLEEFIDHMIGSMEEEPLPIGAARVLKHEYSEQSEQVAQFLVNLKVPKGMTPKELRAWKKRALNFFVRDRALFRKTSRNVAIRRVVDDTDIRSQTIWSTHETTGHRGTNTVYSMLSQRYWWPSMYEDVRKRLQRCPECQLRSSKRRVDMLTNTYSFAIWESVAIDVVYMPHCQGKKYLVIAREYLSGWPEARALSNNKSSTIAKFIYEDIICRWSTTRKLLVDGGPDFAKVVKYLAANYKINRIQSSSHNPQAMGKIEGGHKPIVNALAKLSGLWVNNLPTVLLADRISTQSQTGYSPYQLITGQNPVLPLELELPTWQTLPFREVKDRAQLLAIRAMQLDLRDQFTKDAVARTNRLRQAKKEYWDDTKEIRREELRLGDLVLLWNSIREIDMSRDRKLDARWMGPYRVRRPWPERGTYQIEDLDGTPLPHTVPGKRLKPFRQRTSEDIAEQDRGRMKLWDPEKWENTNVSADTPAGPIDDDEHDDQDTPSQPQLEEGEASNAPRLVSQPSAIPRLISQPSVVITKRLTEEERRAFRLDFVPSSDSDTSSESDGERA